MLLLCDIAMILMNFHTLLIIFGLTYYLSAPQCQFLFSAVFLFQVSPLLKVPEKFREKYRKNQRTGSFAKSPRGARGEPGEPRRPPGTAPPLAAPGGRLGPLVHLWLPPSANLFSVTGKLRGQDRISQTLSTNYSQWHTERAP